MAEKMGILGRKIGMTRIFANDGSSVPVTVVQAGPCPVVQVKDVAKDGYNAVQIGFGEAKEKHVNKPTRGHMEKAGCGLVRNLREIRLEAVAEVKAGDVLTAEMFANGDKVKITGTSIGKGYAGPMKRWNFAGAPASHGHEKVHRSGGSIGNNTFPGKVWKNKKMAGHMGARQVTVPSLQILEVRAEDNVILVKGPVPGAKNGLILIRKQ